MTNNRYERVDQLRAVEREYQVVGKALDRLRVAVVDGTVFLPEGTSPRDLVTARRQLEATFLIRLWAEFETAVGSYYGWRHNDPDPRIRAIDLITSVAASPQGRVLAGPARDKVHEVREYRNSLVHARDEPAPLVPLSEARSRLVRYLNAKLPEQWD